MTLRTSFRTSVTVEHEFECADETWKVDISPGQLALVGHDEYGSGGDCPWALTLAWNGELWEIDDPAEADWVDENTRPGTAAAVCAFLNNNPPPPIGATDAPHGVELLRQLDAELYPWSEVGEVPTEAGSVWVTDGIFVMPGIVALDLDDGKTLTLYDDGAGEAEWWHGFPLSALEDCVEKELRFRRRWTPEPPR